MFRNFLRITEPFLKALSHRSMSPWKGNHIKYSDLGEAIIPWGFVSQRDVLEKVTPARADGRVEKRAESLDLNVQEFLQGTEVAYKAIARLFASRPVEPEAIEGRAPGAGEAKEGGGASTSPVPSATTEAGAGREEADGRGGGASGRFGDGQRAQGGVEEAGGRSSVLYTNFLELDVASPQMSLFLNDVLDSYERQRLIPRLSVRNVDAKLCNLGVRFGGINKNTNFMGSMSLEEARYHLTMGMLGPEGMVINELEGNAPQKVIADVCLTCEEEFLLEDEEGNVVHRTEHEEPKMHYLTLQSNVGDEGGLEWQITNINDVIKPNLDYYFSRFGH